MEPKDKKSKEWRDWFVRHKFGGMTIASIKMGSKEELKILQAYLKDIIKEKKKKRKPVAG